MVIQYKCPNCGADMAFDSTSGMLHCGSCGRKDSVDTFNKDNKSSDTNKSSNSNKSKTNKYFEDNEATEYKCNNCGAQLITDKDTSATTCSFCGAGMVLTDRLDGHLSPELIIPFKISKEQAMEAFKKWCKKGLLTPKGFMNADRIKSITGLYVPFWLYDLNCIGDAEAHCTRVRTYESGDYIYTETKHYEVYRSVDLTYDYVPVDASEKMNDELMEKLEPFNYSALNDFNMPYLAGFIAEKYSYDDKTLLPHAKTRVTNYVNEYINQTISGYTTTNYRKRNVSVQEKDSHYVLFPVWMVCYDYKKSEHTFAMNGQTGKIVGKPPLSAQKIALWLAGISTSSFLIMRLLTLIFGGM